MRKVKKRSEINDEKIKQVGREENEKRKRKKDTKKDELDQGIMKTRVKEKWKRGREEKTANRKWMKREIEDERRSKREI